MGPSTLTTKSLLEATKTFLNIVVLRCSETHGLDVSSMMADHVCWRCESYQEYHRVCQDMRKMGSVLLLESMIGGRPISTFELPEPLQVETPYGTFFVPCVEIPSPKPNRPYASGMEHVEFVVGTNQSRVDGTEDLVKFRERYNHVPFDTRAFDKDINPDLSLSLGVSEEDDMLTLRPISCKFHQQPLSKVIAHELEMGTFVPVPKDYFRNIKDGDSDEFSAH